MISIHVEKAICGSGSKKHVPLIMCLSLFFGALIMTGPAEAGLRNVKNVRPVFNKAAKPPVKKFPNKAPKSTKPIFNKAAKPPVKRFKNKPPKSVKPIFNKAAKAAKPVSKKIYKNTQNRMMRLQKIVNKLNAKHAPAPKMQMQPKGPWAGKRTVNRQAYSSRQNRVRAKSIIEQRLAKTKAKVNYMKPGIKRLNKMSGKAKSAFNKAASK